MLEPDQLRRLIDAAGQPLKAMILLGTNAGFGNHDCATLPRVALDLDTGWLSYARPKTGIPRRCPLWPETVAAIREVVAARPDPGHGAAAGLVFLTARATPWIHTTPKGGRVDNVAIQFGLLLKRVGLHRDRLGFYTLRYIFRTIADAVRDTVAADIIMGHTDPTMAEHYRERVEDSRLQAVAAHVREWLFGKAPEAGPADTTAKEIAPATAEAHEEAETPSDELPALRLYVG
jgi:integrase